MELEPICKDRRCIVVGSAPGVSIPPMLPHDVYLGANGGADVVKRLTGSEPPIILTTSYLFRAGRSAQEDETISRLSGMRPRSLWVDVKHGPYNACLSEAFATHEHKGNIHTVDGRSRSAVIRSALLRAGCKARVSTRISTGVWGICLALASGAREVVAAGISLDSGHDGMPWDTAPRDHIEEDRACLLLLLRSPHVRMHFQEGER